MCAAHSCNVVRAFDEETCDAIGRVEEFRRIVHTSQGFEQIFEGFMHIRRISVQRSVKILQRSHEFHIIRRNVYGKVQFVIQSGPFLGRRGENNTFKTVHCLHTHMRCALCTCSSFDRE